MGLLPAGGITQNLQNAFFLLKIFCTVAEIDKKK